jgi:hypothetical protein
MVGAMIALTKLRDLDLTAASTECRMPHLSAASGLACVQSSIYVVADDELHLGAFRAGSSEPGHLVRLFDGKLPDAKSDRKLKKPDLEALTLLPPATDDLHGTLLVLGSGSTRNRRMGALVALDAQGAPAGSPRIVDCTPLLAPVADRFPSLNIEGAAICSDELRLLQRGNRSHPANAIIRFSLSAVRDALASGLVDRIDLLGVHVVDLGTTGGIPYSFTDAAGLPDGSMVFTAVAEDTQDSYNDGPCCGAAIGIVDSAARLQSLQPLDRPHKIEGVDARMDGDVIRLLLVTDADDAGIPAGLFAATLKR